MNSIFLKNDSEKLEAEILLSRAINKPKEFLLIHPEYRPNLFQKLKFKYYLWLYHRGWSIACILGHKEFFGLDFIVNRHVLIPRPETELTVDAVLDLISDNQTTLIDVGTGSGCVPIAIAKNCANKNLKIIAIDISKKALRIARKNAEKHNVKIEFLKGSLLEPVNLSLHQSDIIITANLPYLTNKQFTLEKSIQKEPKIALVADNKNGLSLYEKLLGQIKTLDSRLCGNDRLGLLLEIDPTQAEGIKTLIKKYLPDAKMEIKKDLAGRDRLAVLTNTH